jgi:hypothetical protein
VQEAPEPKLRAVEETPKKLAEEPLKKRAPLPRIAREDDDDAAQAPRVERIGPAAAPRAAAKPAPAEKRPARQEVVEVVDAASRRGKPR